MSTFLRKRILDWGCQRQPSSKSLFENQLLEEKVLDSRLLSLANPSFKVQDGD